MKIVIITLLLLSFLYSDEMQRIEAIVNDITELREDYEECQAELKGKNITTLSAKTSTCQKSKNEAQKYKKLYKNEKQKNIILKAKVDYNKDLELSNKNLSAKVKKLEKLVNRREKLLKSKEIKKQYVDKICKEIDTFPKLMMKKEYQAKSNEADKIIKFKAAPFHLNVESIIYDSIEGKKIDKWEKGTSFTSNKKTKSWIQVTGYFVNKKWRSSKKEMWIKIAQVSKK